MNNLCLQETNQEPSTMFGEKTPSIREISINEIKNQNKGGRGTTQERKEKFLRRALKIHRNKYDYSSSVYVNNNTKIKILCPHHGEFLQTPHSHLAGRRCPKCGEIVKIKKKSKNTPQFIDSGERIHGNKYSYTKTKYINNYTKVIITCPLHGDFLQSPNCHISQKQGCPTCGGRCKKEKSQFVEDAEKIHGNRYNYSKVEYVSNKKHVCIICKKHGEFFQKPNGHLSGTGCPRCQTSKGELKIEKYLISHGMDFVPQKSFYDCINPVTGQKLKFDFYLPTENLLIEYDGEQHFFGGYVGYHKLTDSELLDIRMRDSIKTEYAKSRGINLLRINYGSMKKINDILSQKLNLTNNGG